MNRTLKYTEFKNKTSIYIHIWYIYNFFYYLIQNINIYIYYLTLCKTIIQVFQVYDFDGTKWQIFLITPLIWGQVWYTTGCSVSLFSLSLSLSLTNSSAKMVWPLQCIHIHTFEMHTHTHIWKYSKYIQGYGQQQAPSRLNLQICY